MSKRSKNLKSRRESHTNSGKRTTATLAAGSKETALEFSALASHDRQLRKARKEKIARMVAKLESVRQALADEPRSKRPELNLYAPFALRAMAPWTGPKVPRKRLSEPLRPKKDCDQRRKERRSVLMAKGKVNKPGGAPGKDGKYRRRECK